VLQGEFEIEHAQWTKPERQMSVNMLSKKASGKKKDPETPAVTADIKGGVLLSNEVAKFQEVSFKAPGAEAILHGAYNLEDAKIDFHGDLKTEASISDDSSGVKAVLLKPLDPLFKKKHAGAVVPVEMTGAYHNPHFGVSLQPKK
jgi:hypothetical protein